VGPGDVQRWNDEWIEYLRREWMYQLEPHTAFPHTPALPARPVAMLDLEMRRGWQLNLYCDAEALQGRRVMELGCGCGNMGKLLGRYAASYLGVDYSTLALKVAQLVSPPNCTYVHVGDEQRLTAFHGRMDTVVARHFWIHQNLALARENLRFLADFLVPGGRLYADFFNPDPAEEQFIVLQPSDPLSRRYPSAMFHYREADVDHWLEGQPFRLLRQEVVLSRQRRYVVLERLADATR
jgi:SAM-dependent methyltransferase